MAKIVCTGGSGFIGSHLLPVLRKKGHEVINIDLKEGDDILDCILPKADLVIHLAAQTSVMDSLQFPWHDAETNVLGTMRIAHHYRNTRVIYASSGGAIQYPLQSPYAASKLCGEEYIRLFCKEYDIMRFANVYGPGDEKGVVNKFIMAKECIVYGDGSSTRDYVHVHDLIQAILRIMNRSARNDITYLGYGKSYPIINLAKATGKPIRYEGKREGEVWNSKVKNTLKGWKPKINIIQYIRKSCHNSASLSRPGTNSSSTVPSKTSLRTAKGIRKSSSLSTGKKQASRSSRRRV